MSSSHSNVHSKDAHHDSHHEHHENYEPGGYLFGQPPRAPGEKRKWESWEPIWYFGYYGTLVTMFVGYVVLNNGQDIDEMARQEAHKRLAQRGETFGWPFPPDYSKFKHE